MHLKAERTSGTILPFTCGERFHQRLKNDQVFGNDEMRLKVNDAYIANSTNHRYWITNYIGGAPVALSLSAMASQYFISSMMPDSAHPTQQSLTVIEIRPSKGGWQCYEAPSVAPFWTGNGAKEDAISYAKGRARFGRGEIRVLNPGGSIERVIRFGESGNKL